MTTVFVSYLDDKTSKYGARWMIEENNGRNTIKNYQTNPSTMDATIRYRNIFDNATYDYPKKTTKVISNSITIDGYKTQDLKNGSGYPGHDNAAIYNFAFTDFGQLVGDISQQSCVMYNRNLIYTNDGNYYGPYTSAEFMQRYPNARTDLPHYNNYIQDIYFWNIVIPEKCVIFTDEVEVPSVVPASQIDNLSGVPIYGRYDIDDYGVGGVFNTAELASQYWYDNYSLLKTDGTNEIVLVRPVEYDGDYAILKILRGSFSNKTDDQLKTDVDRASGESIVYSKLRVPKDIQINHIQVINEPEDPGTEPVVDSGVDDIDRLLGTHDQVINYAFSTDTVRYNAYQIVNNFYPAIFCDAANNVFGSSDGRLTCFYFTDVHTFKSIPMINPYYLDVAMPGYVVLSEEGIQALRQAPEENFNGRLLLEELHMIGCEPLVNEGNSNSDPPQDNNNNNTTNNDTTNNNNTTTNNTTINNITEEGTDHSGNVEQTINIEGSVDKVVEAINEDTDKVLNKLVTDQLFLGLIVVGTFIIALATLSD